MKKKVKFVDSKLISELIDSQFSQKQAENKKMSKKVAQKWRFFSNVLSLARPGQFFSCEETQKSSKVPTAKSRYNMLHHVSEISAVRESGHILYLCHNVPLFSIRENGFR
jgi:hypothetical protein